MLREVLKSKIYYATVTGAELYYQGSITVDARLIEEADLIIGEKVEVLNLNNGARFQTYVIKGKRNSGIVCLNGPAARLGVKGDKIIILSYGLFNSEELLKHRVRFVVLDKKNKIKSTLLKRD
ncbi:MAG: aspartate 1-decarboxylase [Candidatus Omnitrophica bacterium]|nr:aspartate 1-decarboxylase [Candidatus Omnitrophota bacterium]